MSCDGIMIHVYYNKSLFILAMLLSWPSASVWLQEVIQLQNPSFEDIPRAGNTSSPPLRGWNDCGLARFPGETPPDIHPVPDPAWDVTMQAIDGNTYLGMVTRYNDTWESLSQALSTPIMGGICYTFSAYIARSSRYKSSTHRYLDSLENFDRPAVMMIWGGNYFCDKAELLGESPAVSNTTWKLYKFLFHPKNSYKYITIEAFYKTPILEAYNGHILVDGMSDIEPTDCPLIPTDIIAKVEDPPVKVAVVENTGSGSGKKTSGGNSGTIKGGTSSSGPKAFKPVLLTELVPEKMFVGQKIRLDYLYFQADSVNLMSNSYKVLDELADYLKAYPKTVIEIGGHTNTIPPDDYCNHLSTERAKSVQQYLVSQGVPSSRLQYKGYGKTDPIIPYDHYNREARLKNQRVEIKILSLN